MADVQVGGPSLAYTWAQNHKTRPPRTQPIAWIHSSPLPAEAGLEMGKNCFRTCNFLEEGRAFAGASIRLDALSSASSLWLLEWRGQKQKPKGGALKNKNTPLPYAKPCGSGRELTFFL